MEIVQGDTINNSIKFTTNYVKKKSLKKTQWEENEKQMQRGWINQIGIKIMRKKNKEKLSREDGARMLRG